ncbi:hypothetical protein MCOR27_010977 [Pyricularia oryzae]|uniref:Ysc84 actin-binding domain-containing protein n=2 Tax=Pyricularia TaxID=48558 RepID=A0ABQ8NBZ8_PYRGI|nr:hypothetical protein MCOR01_000891 [Pyricularia oryzae]KAI6294552.1 hypothetical protein MCOR33_008360 [Pyricularia grisea]KAH9428341.1 hypothetical protein MCOR02_012581 [Pyricularia oryzae]KAI6252877.1 hypothetical protein MCOR19_010531 [Pyricularia oryzae]KAI6264862.1 hypothetical protein MCOR26_011087 [Pyricularia oryzae]
MQRVSSLLPTWERTRSVDGRNRSSSSTGASSPKNSQSSNSGAFGRVFGWADRITPSRISGSTATHSTTPPTAAAAATTQAVVSKYGKETYWPSSLERECEKAALILKSFCTDGFLSYESDAGAELPNPPPLTISKTSSSSSQVQIMKKVPPRIIQKAAGLAIFSCMRSGLWMSGSGGSGILIARKADGTWSPPSGILLHTAALGFVVGVDIYDCVLVINSFAALEMFTRSKVMLGADLGLTVGPVVPVGLLENDARWKELDNSVLTYLKARGQHRAVQLDGSLVTERGNENEKFYGAGVEIPDILAGNVRREIPEISPLFEAIKAAEGRTDYDVRIMQALSQQPAPGDATIETPAGTPISPIKPNFGLPDVDDPDPFGIIALEMAGLEIREAGANNRPASTNLDYCPSPASPISNNSQRQSTDTFVSRSNRGSYMSSRTQATSMTDAFTQTDLGESARTSPSPSNIDSKKHTSPKPPSVAEEPEEIDYTKIDMSPLESFSFRYGQLAEQSAPTTVDQAVQLPKTKNSIGPVEDAASIMLPEDEEERDGDADDEDDESDDDEPIIYEVATTAQPTRAVIMARQAAQVVSAKGALVTIPKRHVPSLPARNPARSSHASQNDIDVNVAYPQSPARSSFDSTEANQTPKSTLNLSTPPRSHKRNSSSVYFHTQVDPATPKASCMNDASSVDEEFLGEPRTPRADEHVDQTTDGFGRHHELKLTPNLNTATIQVL